MSYSNILVAVAVTPESQQLLAKAVSIARPVKGHISLITLASDPEMYNQLAAPMLEDLRQAVGGQAGLPAQAAHRVASPQAAGALNEFHICASFLNPAGR